MARRARFHLHSAIYHVMLRGNDGQPIFFSDEDRCRFCLLIQEGVERFGHTIHAFCFMSNHVHLAIQVGGISISRIIQNLAFRYTRYINNKYKRIGHLFQGRFRSIVVDGNRYLKELVRYIHLNPIRANLVKLPEQYLWSSHRAYVYIDEFTWLTRDDLLKRFGNTRNEAHVEYESFILKDLDKKTILNFKSGSFDGILGNEEFVNNFLEAVNDIQIREIQLPELIAKVCNYFTLSEPELRGKGKNRLGSNARAALALIVREINNLSIEELGAYLARDSSGLSKLASRLERKCIQSPELATEIDQFRKYVYTSSI